MRAEIFVLIKSTLVCVLYHDNVADAFTFTAPSASIHPSYTRARYSICASSLRYSPENTINWGRQSPRQYDAAQAARPMEGFDERIENQPSWSQTEFPSPNRNAREMMNFAQFSDTLPYRNNGPGQMRIGYDGNPNPTRPFVHTKYQHQYRRDNDLGHNLDSSFERPGPYEYRQNSFDGHREYQWNEPQITLDQQGEESFRTHRRGYDDEYTIDQIYYDQESLQNHGYYEYERNRRSPDQAMLMRQMEREEYSWPNNGMGFESDERTMRGMEMGPLRGFEIMDRMLDDMLDGLGMINDVMDRLNFGMDSRMNQDQASIRYLLDDAYTDILADPAAAELVGDSISLGFPTAQSTTSSVINGVRRSRVEMVIPIKGSRGLGQLRLLADEDGISRLEVGVDGRVINIHGGGRRIYNSRKDMDEEVIDATVVE